MNEQMSIYWYMYLKSIRSLHTLSLNCHYPVTQVRQGLWAVYRCGWLNNGSQR